MHCCATRTIRLACKHSRRGAVEHESLSDEARLSEESSRESLEGSVGSDHGRSSRAVLGVRQQRLQLRAASRNRRQESYQDRSSSRGEERRRGRQSRKQGLGQHRRTSRSENGSSRSSGDSVLDDEGADVKGGTARGDDNLGEEARGKDRDRYQRRHSQRKTSRSTARLNEGNRQEKNVTSDAGSDEDNGKWAFMKRERQKQRLPQRVCNSLSEFRKECGSSQSGASDRTDSFSSDAAAEDVRRSDVLDGGDSQFRTRSSERSPQRRRSTSAENRRNKRAHHHRRRRAEQDDSEAECYGWSGNRYSWDMSDATSLGSLSGQQELSNRNGGHEDVKRKSMPRFSDKNEGAAHNTGGDNNSAAGAQRSLTTSAHRNSKELDHSEASESYQKQPDMRQREENPGGSVSTHTPAHSSGAHGVRSFPTTPASRAAIAGKPIRGARWGEAIGVRSRVFDTSTIPTKRVDLKNFVCSPLRSGPGTVLRCYIERDRSGTHKISNVFSMYADLDDGSGRMLLAARKVNSKNKCPYVTCSRRRTALAFISRVATAERCSSTNRKTF